jgi:hypothetical protein
MNENEILENVQARLNEAAVKRTFPQWVKKNIFLESKPFSFDLHPELIQLYSDTHPNIKIRKAVQVGASCYAISYLLFAAIECQANGLYCGPTDDWMKDFVPGKVDPIIRDSPFIHAQIKDVNQTFLKKIGFGTLYFRGLKTETNTASISADVLIKDEKDLLHQRFAEIVEERLEHSKVGIIRELSKPSYDDFGISKDFESGDQHYYLFRCGNCRTYTNVVTEIWEDPENSVIKRSRKGSDTYYFRCKRCGSPLDPSTGTWVAAFPGKDTRSYQLSQCYWQWAPARFQNVAHKIWVKYREAVTQEKKEQFWRGIIGLAFAGANQPLTDSIFNQVQGTHRLRPSWAGISYMGVDNGTKWHYAVAHQQGYRLLFHDFGEVDDASKLDAVMRKHNVRFCLVDMEPNVHDSKKFALRHLKRVAVQDFQGNETREKKTEKEGKEVKKINLPRTESLDETIDCIQGGIIVLPDLADGDIIKIVRNHLKKLIKQKVKNNEGKESFKYLRGVENHYGMAINNCLHAWYQVQQKITRGSGVLPYGRPLNVANH